MSISFSRLWPPPRSTLFPYTTLFRSVDTRPLRRHDQVHARGAAELRQAADQSFDVLSGGHHHVGELVDQDRKSTRLNSSHPSISYAVFCLKKKIIRAELLKYA